MVVSIPDKLLDLSMTNSAELTELMNKMFSDMSAKKLNDEYNNYIKTPYLISAKYKTFGNEFLYSSKVFIPLQEKPKDDFIYDSRSEETEDRLYENTKNFIVFLKDHCEYVLVPGILYKDKKYLLEIKREHYSYLTLYIKVKTNFSFKEKLNIVFTEYVENNDDWRKFGLHSHTITYDDITLMKEIISLLMNKKEEEDLKKMTDEEQKKAMDEMFDL